MTNIPDIREQAKRRYLWIKKTISGCDEIGDVNLEFNETPEKVVSQVLPLLLRQFDIKEPALFIPLLRTLASILTNTPICFSTCYDILERPGWFTAPDAQSYRIKLLVFRELVQVSVPKSSTSLEEIGALDDRHLSLLFADLFTPFLTNEQRYRFVSIGSYPLLELL